ncbi:16S rRNA (guanine(527)-N(7))-methyltransferase RsmG [[Phormidium ambiguum] IAM M-71]|uniref:Ribosomal RNA small subunit methyltransferase G n=1 Tax=[Phormidium ambiguum] IAM M-71 TaxID=454136 RepID=A0A1U7IMR0_9CYAN|nr:16S rRNA (guanine(527)-N(7))-methyltransferase RsmG [Phormidium ambiguum]OKH38474.1 16S rRNA (guanine(527)-N(7))-methyltransferase RsmG [Phormidium ambiguum IAM M-71]
MSNQIEIPKLPEMMELWQETLNWQPSNWELSKFQLLYELICQGNQQLNLTRITEPTDFWEKHLWDSLRGIAPFLDKTKSDGRTGILPVIANPKVIDIGTGAGFPGVPIAITQPNFQVTLLDSTRKKLTFLESLIAELEIKNATTLTGRAEELGKQSQYKEVYDLALIRAVGSALVCAEYALPFLKVGGLAILYRGNWTEEEQADLRSTLGSLGGAIEAIDPFTTPISNSIRHCLHLRKVAVIEPNKKIKIKK